MLLVGALLAVAYLVGRRRVRRPWPVARTASFVAGCIVLGAAAAAPDSSFTAHMCEHIAIGMVAPVLLALGAPITLALQSSGPSTSRTLRLVLRSRLVRALTHPLVAWMVFGATLVALVFSPLLVWSARNDAVHALVHIHFLLAGSLFATTFIAIDPIPHPLPHGARLLGVLLLVPFHAFVGVALLTARRPLFPSLYPSIGDQHSAAGLLWSSGELLTLAMGGIVFVRWWNAEQRASARIDRQLANT